MTEGTPCRVSPQAPSTGFDRVARVYRWAEYMALGTLLRRTREHFLPELTRARHALVLGDGDGRFTAVLLRLVPAMRVVAVDSSAAMLNLLSARCARQGDSGRLERVHQSALGYHASSGTDLVATHFFLDCLTQDEVNGLAKRLATEVSEGCLWLISEFGLPERGFGRLAAKVYIRALYVAFRLLTGLRPQRLPDHRTALSAAGFSPLKRTERLKGLLISELWQLSRPSPEPGVRGTT